jgi:hypothetical protein
VDQIDNNISENLKFHIRVIACFVLELEQKIVAGRHRLEVIHWVKITQIYEQFAQGLSNSYCIVDTNFVPFSIIKAKRDNDNYFSQLVQQNESTLAQDYAKFDVIRLDFLIQNFM